MPTATVDAWATGPAARQGWVGPYIGETMGRARSVVHFDPLLAAVAQPAHRGRHHRRARWRQDHPGPAAHPAVALRGVTIAVIDPKGDAEPLVDVLQARGRKARVLPLGAAAPGLLDPFSFGDDLADRRTMATETLRLLLPRMSEERESAMIQAVAAVAAREQAQPGQGRPAPGGVAGPGVEEPGRGAATHVGDAAGPAVLLADRRAADRRRGLDHRVHPGRAHPAGLRRSAADDYSYEQRLSVALLYLVSQFARRLLNGMDRRMPKAIFLDEAWAITSTPEGAKLVPEVSRMGRSRNTALILVSQNAGDLLTEQVTNCLSSVFAFRSSERVEVANVMALLGVEASEEHKAVLRGLGNGECIFRDLEGRAGRIGIDLISDEVRQWLDTNPTRARPAESRPRHRTATLTPAC